MVTTTVPQPNSLPNGNAAEPEHAPENTDEVGSLTEAPFVVRWGLFDAFLGVPVILVGTLIIAVALALTAISVSAANALTVLSLQVMMAGWAIWTARRKGNGPFVDFGVRLVGLMDFISAVVLGFSLLMIGSVVAGFALWLLGMQPADQATNTGIVTDAESSLWKWVMIVLVVFGAPIAEELFFRGLLLGALRRRFGSVVAVLGSALAFTSVHYGGGPLDESIMLFSVVGVIGVVLGGYVIRTGRVLPTIIAHSVFNALVVTANF